MNTNWTYIETRIPPENQECEITSPEIRGTRMAVFVRNAPMQHWRMTDCIHPAQNCHVSANKSAWRILSNREDPTRPKTGAAHMNTTATHTPGPWRIVNGRTHTGHGIRTIENGATVIAHMADTEASGSLAPLHNARLIAAAPDLLAALQRLLHPMGGDDSDLEFAADAISKATGARHQ